MQTSLHFAELDLLCIDGLLRGQCYAIDDPRHVQYLGPAQIPYRAVRDETGEWLLAYAAECDPVEDPTHY